MSEITIYSDPAIDYTRANLDGRRNYAYELARASALLPRAVVNQQNWEVTAAQTFYITEVGAMMGIHPLVALSGIHMIEGKWTISSGLMSALVRNAGHKLRVTESGSWEAGDYVATATLVRSDDPDFPFVATFDKGDAERAEVLNKGNWKKYPKAMCKARAISAVCRMGAEDALNGAQYTPEEMGAAVDEMGEVIEGEIVHDQAPQQQPEPQPQPQPQQQPEQPEQPRQSVRPVQQPDPAPAAAPAGATHATAPTDTPAEVVSDERILASVSQAAIAHSRALWEAAAACDVDAMLGVWKSARESRCATEPALVFNEAGVAELYGRDETGAPLALGTMIQAEGALVRAAVEAANAAAAQNAAAEGETVQVEPAEAPAENVVDAEVVEAEVVEPEQAGE